MFRIANQNYSCEQCGKCCRAFRVAITADEEKRFHELKWPANTHLPAELSEKCLSYRCFKREGEEGKCIFLDENNHCRMHQAFGFDVKALSCRAYPLEFLATFDGEISVAARYDCPAVAANHGKPLSSQLSEIKKLSSDQNLHLGNSFNGYECSGLTRHAIDLICNFLIKELSDGLTPLPALHTLVTRLIPLGTTFLNDISTMGLVLPSMRDKAALEYKLDGPPQLNWPAKNELRKQLVHYMRRDESLPDFSFHTRWNQMIATAKVFLGNGNPSEFCVAEHPSVSIRSCRLFDEKHWQQDATDLLKGLEVYRRFLITRLETYQFFGRAYYGEQFFVGLTALMGTCHIAQLLARIHAHASGRHCIQYADGTYAASAIDHCFGRKTRI